ncbi:MAG: YHYH protein [Gemmatimonas sp.]
MKIVAAIGLAGALAIAAALPAHADTAGRDLHHLVAGDGRVTADGPKPGYIYVCTTAPFARAPRGREDTPWVRSDGTFDPGDKPVVEGGVRWPSELRIAANGESRVITANALPSSPTGVFPIPRDSAAFAYDRNPNAIAPQTVRWTLPRLPVANERATCLGPGGPIGLFLDGSYLFNALDAAGRDGVAHEVQDSCGGHPARRGDYHHHMADLCVDLGDPAGTSPIVGYAVDGFAITGPYRDGRVVTNAELDACHGRVDEIDWDGERRRMYHYVANFEYPYTLGCYRGTPMTMPRPEGRRDAPRGPGARP